MSVFLFYPYVEKLSEIIFYFFPLLFKANYSYEGSGGSGYRKFTRWAEWV